MRVLLPFVAIAVLPTLVVGQGSEDLLVDIEVKGVSMRGDTTYVEYVLTNRPESKEYLSQFTVDVRASVVRVSRLQPGVEWQASTNYLGRPVATWSAVGEGLAPGETSFTLAYEGAGLPAVVDSWVSGYVPPAPAVARTDPSLKTDAAIKTVGVAREFDLRPSNLLARLVNLTNRACGELRWSSHKGACNGLLQTLDQARRNLDPADTAIAKDAVNGFLSGLEQLRGQTRPGINESAYWLLKANGEFLLGKL